MRRWRCCPSGGSPGPASRPTTNPTMDPTQIPLRFVATSATRDAENRLEFVAGVKAILGVEPYVATGDEEARFSFTGATTELPHDRHHAPYLVIDIGGGSTEFVLGDGERG